MRGPGSAIRSYIMRAGSKWHLYLYCTFSHVYHMSSPSYALPKTAVYHNS